MFGAKQQVPHGDEDYKETKRQRQCNSWRYQLGGGPFRAKRCRSFTILRRGELSGAEHELSSFHSLRVWGHCIDRCYLVDPSFVRRHLAVN
jgi:hypothetical protein